MAIAYCQEIRKKALYLIEVEKTALGVKREELESVALLWGARRNQLV